MKLPKKLKLKKLKKSQRKKLASIALPVLAGLVGLIIGSVTTKVINSRTQPANIVWSADSTVKIPSGLRGFLEDRDDCKEYKETGSPKGVGLWGVYQTSKNSYAKIAYGCSWSLSSYIMAVKQNGTWQLLRPEEYFAPFKDGIDPRLGALPFCTVIETYKIPKDIEPFCVQADGSARSNEL